MKPEEQRIAIAEACGWTPYATDKIDLSARYFDKGPWWRNAENCEVASINQLPDYLNDLNAMHEAEKILSNEQAFTMREHAWSIASFKEGKCGHASRDEQGRNCYNATATQRAEAFLRTLNLYTP